MEENILVCEDSTEGVLTAVYQAYAWKLSPLATTIQIGEGDLRLFAQYREVGTDRALAAKVASTIKRRFGEETWEDICYALASCAQDKGQAVYQTIAAGLSGKIRGPLMEGLTEEAIYRVFVLSRHSHKEAQRMMQFLRFREVEGNTLFARIEPDADVTAFVMPHYADRFPQENFIIADTRRKLAGIHAAGQEWFLVRMEDGMAAAMENLASYDTEEERELAEMFRKFCRSAAVKERDNRMLQQQLMPLKYRAFMTDFEKGPGLQSRNKT